MIEARSRLAQFIDEARAHERQLQDARIAGMLNFAALTTMVIMRDCEDLIDAGKADPSLLKETQSS